MTIGSIYHDRVIAKLERRICSRFDRCCHEGRDNTRGMRLREFMMKMTMNSSCGRFGGGVAGGKEYTFGNYRPGVAQ